MSLVQYTALNFTRCWEFVYENQTGYKCKKCILFDATYSIPFQFLHELSNL